MLNSQGSLPGTFTPRYLIMKRTATAHTPFSPARQAFSLLELLVVITIIATLAGLLFPVITTAMINAKKTVAKSASVNVVIGLNAYFQEYGTYPDLGVSNADTFVAADNHRIMDILRARETGPTLQNPRKITFYTDKAAKGTGAKAREGYDTNGNLLDPWGHQYKLKYDSNYDNRLMAYGEDLDLGAVVWCVGRDGVEVVNYTEFSKGDDVVSWR